MDDLKESEEDIDLTRLVKVTNIWITTRPSPVTWESVISAVESPIVNDKASANLIRQYLNTGTVIIY